MNRETDTTVVLVADIEYDQEPTFDRAHVIHRCFNLLASFVRVDEEDMLIIRLKQVRLIKEYTEQEYQTLVDGGDAALDAVASFQITFNDLVELSNSIHTILPATRKQI